MGLTKTVCVGEQKHKRNEAKHKTGGTVAQETVIFLRGLLKENSGLMISILLHSFSSPVLGDPSLIETP